MQLVLYMTVLVSEVGTTECPSFRGGHNRMEGAEEGECSSEDEIGQYVPLERPVQSKPSFRAQPGEVSL